VHRACQGDAGQDLETMWVGREWDGREIQGARLASPREQSCHFSLTDAPSCFTFIITFFCDLYSQKKNWLASKLVVCYGYFHRPLIRLLGYYVHRDAHDTSEAYLWDWSRTRRLATTGGRRGIVNHYRL
jgi:hypothetical protein